MALTFPELSNYISVPDYPPHCPICNERAELIGDFTHTNFKGALYDCPSGDLTHRFVDQEDDYFSISYWEMTEKQREIYEDFSTAQRRVFLAMKEDEKVVLLRLNKKHRRSYFNAKYKEIIDEYESFLNSEFYEYPIYE